MSRSRAAMTSAFGRPIVEPRAQTWRFRLDSATESSSTSVSLPTPERASASAHQEPTPPRPNTITCAARSLSIASAPSSISVRFVLSLTFSPPILKMGGPKAAHADFCVPYTLANQLMKLFTLAE